MVLTRSRSLCTAAVLIACCAPLASTAEPVVFVGKCFAVRSFWAGKVVLSEGDFQTLRSVRGNIPAVVAVRTLGGRVQEPVPVNALVIGGVVFTEGQTALIIATPISENLLRVDRKEHYYPIHSDPATGEAFIQLGTQREPLESFLERVVGRIKDDSGAAR